jgi:hypothetical protein
MLRMTGVLLTIGACPGAQRESRELAIEPRGDATAPGTPLVVGTRETSDAEFFRMVATDGSSARPTSGFITATDGPQLNASLLLLGWGSVIEVSDSLTMAPEIHHVRAGVTLRGARRLLDNGPGLVVGDFDGDRVADLARAVNLDWVWSRSGLTGFVVLRAAAGTSLQTLPVGRFDGNARTGVIFFGGLDFWIARGADPAAQISRQHMR